MSKHEDCEYVNNNIVYTISLKEIDEDEIVDIIITLKDKNKTNKAIGYIGIRLVRLYDNTFDTIMAADNLDANLGLDMSFLVNTDNVRKYCNSSRLQDASFFNYLGSTYQFDLLPEYQNKGIEQYFIDNLGEIIQERQKDICMMASTFCIAYKDCDNELIDMMFCRKREFEAPITEESFARCDNLIVTEWKDYRFSYVDYTNF